ncbi:hypothetical protein EVA_16424 [gut metagenome]|uniref:Uncharacterized protein n=1 Tax=gut metagenome TaxID=749906 RepID=J9G7M8_9ZZZZ
MSKLTVIDCECRGLSPDRVVSESSNFAILRFACQ